MLLHELLELLLREAELVLLRLLGVLLDLLRLDLDEVLLLWGLALGGRLRRSRYLRDLSELRRNQMYRSLLCARDQCLGRRNELLGDQRRALNQLRGTRQNRRLLIFVEPCLLV